MLALLLLCVVVNGSRNAEKSSIFDRTAEKFIARFSCGRLFYRTLFADDSDDSLYVGAMDRLFKLANDDINLTRCDMDALKLSPSTLNREFCVLMNKKRRYDCRNHIKVIQRIAPDRLYVCGTNAQKPWDWIINVNLTIVKDVPPGIGHASGKCAPEPEYGDTAVWVEKGNPGNIPALYSGTAVNAKLTDRAIFRSDLYDPETGKRKYNFTRTLPNRSAWLDDPEFVASFEVEDYVYFFFRETAREGLECGKAPIYARVARVCKRDTGGKDIMRRTWATYSKARLNCSIPGDPPYYLDEIKAVYLESKLFYAVFTTPVHGIYGSAICAYHLDDIDRVFFGDFKIQNESGQWITVPSNKAPSPRPGLCANDTQKLPREVLEFSREHTLMSSAVDMWRGKPVFHRGGLAFTSIVGYRELFHTDDTYSILYAGTTDGTLLKIMNNLNEWAPPKVQELVVHKEPIRALKISMKRRMLFVAFDSGVHQYQLNICREFYGKGDRVQCVYDTVCKWSWNRNVCRLRSEKTRESWP